MKVLYCYRYGILGGVSTQLLNRLQVFSSGGEEFEAHLLFGQDHGISRTLEGYPHVVFQRDPRKARTYAKEGRFDAVVVIDSAEYLEAMQTLGIPLVIEVHTTIERGLQYLGERRWEPAGFVVPSEYSRGLLRERFGYGEREPIEVVPNSLDPRLFPRVEVPSPPPGPVFAWVGKLDDHKNWRGFLEVASQIAASSEEARFWMVGGETAPPGTMTALVEELGRRQLAKTVRWFPRVEYTAMHRLYAAVRQSGGAMVVTSRNESFGMSVLEALMSGCPVVASRVGGIPEIAPGRAYLKLYEVDEYSEAVTLALAAAEEREAAELRSHLQRDRLALEERYSERNVAVRYKEILRDFVEQARRRSSARASAGVAAGDQLLREAVEELRLRAPNGREHPDDPAAFLASLGQILELRSFRLAGLLSRRKGRWAYWLRFPAEFLRICIPRLRPGGMRTGSHPGRP